MTQSILRRLEACDAFADEFASAAPFKHVVIDNFFDEAFCQRVLSDFPSFEDRYALNEMGNVGGKAVRMDVRDISEAFRELDQCIQSKEFLDYISVITGIPNLLYDKDYIGGGTHENRDGQGLDQHVDFNFHPGTRWHRRLNLIVYLNPVWKEAWGGNLQLQTDPWNGNVSGPSIAPLFNRAVIFETTERSWHGFSTIRLPDDVKSLSRKSFAIYFYTKERPVEETAESHSTVYVPEAMPTTLHAGLVLNEAHMVDLRQRFERMLGQLKFLYDREKEFAAQVASLERALGEARSSWRLPIKGYADQHEAPEGMWSDGWVSKEFTCRFEPVRNVRALKLEVWSPEQLDQDQTLQIDLDGKCWVHHFARGSCSSFVLEVKRPAGKTIALSIRAQQTFVPAQAGASGDERSLAWKILSLELTH
jgi:2-oxoglutarate-Fe(II)-dependent oxygenase superfamily protein